MLKISSRFGSFVVFMEVWSVIQYTEAQIGYLIIFEPRCGKTGLRGF